METEIIKDRFNLIAQKYDEQRRFFIPCFDDFYQTSISLLSTIRNDYNSILDLGAGTGLLTKYLWEHFPQAHYTLVDVSDEMLEIAKQRFAGLSNFEYQVTDYSQTLPPKQFDLITSALSIHHLTESDKAALYANIYKNLPENGILINLDQFNPTSELINDYYKQYWYNQIEKDETLKNEKHLWLKRRELDKENTIAETLETLKSIGFSHADCIYSYMKFGVILAIK
jgi:ubiquinone/menaquinone biosynthesis C-methylase UbiE